MFAGISFFIVYITEKVVHKGTNLSDLSKKLRRQAEWAGPYILPEQSVRRPGHLFYSRHYPRSLRRPICTVILQ